MTANCAQCVPRLYDNIIEEVINGVREHFLDDGIDEQVLTELKQTWEAKLKATKAAEHDTQAYQSQSQTSNQVITPHQNNNQNNHTNIVLPSVNLVPVNITVPPQQAGGIAKTITIHVPSTSLANGVAGAQLQTILSSPDAAQTFALETSQAANIIQRQLNAALQQRGIILPQQLLQFNHNASTTQVDGACDQPLQSTSASYGPPMSVDLSEGTNQINFICPTIDKSGNCCNKVEDTEGAISLPPSTISNDLPKPNCKPKKSSKGTRLSHKRAKSKIHKKSCEYEDLGGITIKLDSTVMDKILLDRLAETQVDGLYGTGDSSDEISDDDEDDDDEDNNEEADKNDEDLDEQEEEQEGTLEPALNSDDDVSDDDSGDIFETENVVVCQYDKVTRVRNKWRFQLKDGIMNLKGKDYLFQRATGEGEW